jgi:hypothetical protein
LKRVHVVIALAVLAVGLAGAVGVGRSNAKEEPDQPATAQAVAAATIRHVPAEAKLVKVVDAGSPEDMQVRLTYDVAGESVLLLIEIHSPGGWQADGMGDCDQQLLSDEPDCETQELKDGTKLSVLRQPDGTAAINMRKDGFVLAHASRVAAADPVINTDVLKAIATDRMIGLTTSSRMLELGKGIELTSVSPG